MTKAEKRTRNVKRYQAAFFNLRNLHHTNPTIIETLLYVAMITNKSPVKMMKLLKQYEESENDK